jgi:hypothetical protein
MNCLHRPVHQEQVKVICTEILQTLIQRSLDIFRRVFCVPKLACDENVFPRHTTVLNAFTNLDLVPVDGRAIDDTARSTSPGLACHVPKPTAGILAPVFSVKYVGSGMVRGRLSGDLQKDDFFSAVVLQDIYDATGGTVGKVV